jgi:serine/threonine protein kinase
MKESWKCSPYSLTGKKYIHYLSPSDYTDRSMSQYRNFFVNFIGWYEMDNHIFIAMDYHELGSLDQYLGQPSLPESEAKIITEQVLKALEYMHELKLMHRDLKPAVCPSSLKIFTFD